MKKDLKFIKEFAMDEKNYTVDTVLVTDYTQDGKCSKCCQCCEDLLPMSPTELRRIKKYVKDNGIEELNIAPLEMGINLLCPFSDLEKGSCTIYPVRPMICRVFLCNQSKQTIAKNKKKFNCKNQIVDVRDEVYGRGYNLMDEIEAVMTQIIRDNIGI